MSYDIKLQNLCDHRILWYQGTLEPDMKTVILKYPVASTLSFNVRINNKIESQDKYEIKTIKQNNNIISTVIFFNKIKHFNPLIEFNYSTFSNYCPKCLKLNILDDFFINSNGDIETINKENLLLQEVEKIIVTKISSNIFHDWYGTGLHTLISTKISDRELLYKKIREQITVSIEKLKNIQKQMVSSGRKFDKEELFGKLLKLEINETDDPSMVVVNIVFTSQSETVMEYSQYVNLSDNTRQRIAY